MLLILQILSIFLILMSALPMLHLKFWWIRVFDFPRLQIIILLLPCLTGQLIFYNELSTLDGLVFLLTLAALILQLTYVIPYFPLMKKEVNGIPPSSGTEISFLVANVQMENRKADRLKALLANMDADIVLLVETDVWWAETMNPSMHPYKYSIKIPLENTYGMLLYSKLPLHKGRVEYILKNDIPSIHSTLNIDGFEFEMSCLHPEPPAPDEAKSSKPRDKELIIMAKKIARSDSPYIVMGDLNDVAWSDTSIQFARVSGLRDPRKGRGFMNTYNAKIPLFRWALDHFFVSKHFGIIQIKRLSKIGSDHFPIYLKCGLK
jgi:endonuclease/exonuclease/phosphatase (EEP) superfamily protein YafD